MPVTGMTPSIQKMLDDYNKLPSVQAGGPAGVQAKDFGADVGGTATGGTNGATKDYRGMAEASYMPIYNARVNAINNALNLNTAALGSQKGGINQSYDDQVDSQNQMNVVTKNNLSNSALGRGLGRSSIVTSNLGEADLYNSQLVNKLNSARTNALNGVDAQISAMTTNANNEIATLAGDKESMLADLIRQYQWRDEDNSFRQSQLDAQLSAQQAQEKLAQAQLEYQKAVQAAQQGNWQTQFDYGKTQDTQAQQEYENKLKEQQLAAQIAAAKSSASSAGSKQNTTNDLRGTWDAFYQALDANVGDDFLTKNRSGIVRNLGQAEYEKMYKLMKERTVPMAWKMPSYKSTAQQKTYDNMLEDITSF